MIIRFPDLKTLQLTLTSGAVPPDVAQKPVVAGFGEEDQVWVETVKLSAAVQRELKRHGALVCKSSGAALSTEVSCWLELLPLVPDDAPLDALEQTPVLFDVPSGEELSRLVLEMLRLGNDRQSYRWLEQTDGRAGLRQRPESGRGLLRVVGPPYYSLLRAIDQLGGPEIAPHAFVERAPGVWVEVGQCHPLAAKIKVPKSQLLLLRPPRQWLRLPDAPFRDIYEIVEFHLPDGPSRWQDSPLPHRLTVAPRLRQAGPADGAELWVLRGEAIDELNRFVQNAEDQLLNRLAFAVGEKNGQTLVVLRVRQSKLPPPVLVLPAEAYKSHLKVPNLFLPAGCILHPPLRRDVVRKLLAEDPGQITWLVPGENGQFTPEGLPDNVFRPLTDWVDYVLDRDRESLQAWVQAMQFDFEPIVCDEEQPGKPKKPPASEKTRGPRGGPERPAAKGDVGETTAFEPLPEETATAAEDSALEAFAAIEKVEPSEIEKELHAVEEEFLALPGGLEEESRRVLWPRLADLNARLRKWEDAGICWLNALWDAEAASGDAGRWPPAWFRTEALGAVDRHANSPSSERPWVAGAATTEGVRREVNAEDLEHLLALPEPTTADLRALAAYLAWSARRDPRPTALTLRLSAIQRFLEKHEKLLPVRACWLAWYHLVQLTDGDVLALARARDRLLERLFHNSLRPEQDLPSFLRFAGNPASMRFRGIGQWFDSLCDKVLRWLNKQKVATTAIGKKPATQAYVEMVFAFGLARLGEPDASRRRLKRAQEALRAEKKMAHDFLARAFTLRIEQALAGQPPVGVLFGPEELQHLEDAEKKRQEQTKSGRSEGTLSPRYVVDRMRNLSRILEPHQRVQPYRPNLHEDYARLLAELPDVLDKKVLAERFYHLLHHAPKGEKRHEIRMQVLQGALDQAPRVGESFACDLLDRAIKAYDTDAADPLNPETLRKRAALLQKALFVAGHFDRLEHVHALTARFQTMLQSQFRKMLESAADSLTIETVDDLVGHCLYGLRKLGLRGEIERLLTQITDSILGGRSLGTIAANGNNWSLLRALLPVAGGRYYFGQDDQAETIFQAARMMLFKNELEPRQQTPLACTYASALGQAPPPIAQQRLTEIFEHLEQIYDGYSSMEYFSRFQFQLGESVVLAVVSDDFTQGSQARRWLDEDEYLVRQRVHGDVRQLMAQA
jgi:cellulose synthase operon protein C